MTRYAFLLALSFLLVSCAGMFPPKATPTPAQANSRGAQATPELVQPTSQETPETRYSATPDALGTQAAANLAVTLQAQAREDAAVTETKSVGLTQAAYVAQTQTQQPIDRSTAAAIRETKNVDGWLRMTQEANRATMTYIAPINQATAAVLLADAKYADMSAWMRPVSFFVFAIASIILALCAAYAITRKGIERVTSAMKDGSYFSRPWVPVSAASHTTKPLPVEIEYMRQFIEYAITGLPLGENSMVRAGAWKSGEVWRKKRQLIMTYLDVDCGHIKDHKLTPQGIDFWRDWLDEQSPVLADYMLENSENDGVEAHEHVNNDHVGGGGVIVDENTAQKGEINE